MLKFLWSCLTDLASAELSPEAKALFHNEINSCVFFLSLNRWCSTSGIRRISPSTIILQLAFTYLQKEFKFKKKKKNLIELSIIHWKISKFDQCDMNNTFSFTACVYCSTQINKWDITELSSTWTKVAYDYGIKIP